MSIRILSGKYKNRVILGPEGDKVTRPMLKRIKRSMFDKLHARGMIVDKVVMDIFSGAGTMGLECISRGSSHVVFVERDRLAAGRLKQNMRDLKVPGDDWTLLATDMLSGRFLDRVPLKVAPEGYDLMLFDPPFVKGIDDPKWFERFLTRVEEMRRLIRVEGLMTMRVPVDEKVRDLSGWIKEEDWTYGKSRVDVYLPDPDVTFDEPDENAEEELFDLPPIIPDPIN